MRAITIMYDSLNKKYLSPYGGDVPTPNFQRLAEHCVTFDNCFAGSLPCMPARREMHTGRYNFLHRSWGPIEPFDRSMPEILCQNGVLTQQISDHTHYWQDGGLTYQTRFHAFDMIRGQEGDEWKGRANGFAEENKKRIVRRQDAINREYTRDENCCHARCFYSAMEFLQNNVCEDDWYLHLEYFDPHEPFDAPQKYKDMFGASSESCDWPMYVKMDALGDKKAQESIKNYKACIAMCDDYLGKLLDFFDEHDMWKDTMIIVNTDHGFMLGEHEYFGKNYMPCYNEVANIPCFIHDPRQRDADGTRCDKLCQTIDLPTTILEYFGMEIPSAMQGKNIQRAIRGENIREYALFGLFGKHVNITDGEHIYMRSARDNTKLYEYTLMPTRIFAMFSQEELQYIDEKTYNGFEFAGNAPMLKIYGNNPHVPYGLHLDFDKHMEFGDLLFDLKSDRNQDANVIDKKEYAEVKEKLKLQLIKEMKKTEAPKEQYERLGL